MREPERPPDQKHSRDNHRPRRHDDEIGATAQLTPALHKGMHHEPEQRDGAIPGTHPQPQNVDNGTQAHRLTIYFTKPSRSCLMQMLVKAPDSSPASRPAVQRASAPSPGRKAQLRKMRLF